MKQKKQKTSFDYYKTMRQDWGAVNPVTKVIQDKRKKSREKQDKKYLKNYEY